MQEPSGVAADCSGVLAQHYLRDVGYDPPRSFVADVHGDAPESCHACRVECVRDLWSPILGYLLLEDHVGIGEAARLKQSPCVPNLEYSQRPRLQVFWARAMFSSAPSAGGTPRRARPDVHELGQAGALLRCRNCSRPWTRDDDDDA